MHEITMNGTTYQFNFGMGFLREINKKYKRPIDGMPGEKQDVGMTLTIAKILDGDPEAIVDVLFAGNKGFEPRLTLADIDAYIDDADTDIDALFEKVLDFLRKSNATKKIMKRLQETIEDSQPENL